MKLLRRKQLTLKYLFDMENSLEKILGKPSDYRMCKLCGNINWYENTSCVFCGDETIESETTMSNEDMSDWITEEIQFWTEIEDYTKEEAYRVMKEV